MGAVCSKTPTMHRLSSSSSFPSLLSHEKVGVRHQKRVFFEEPLQTYFFFSQLSGVSSMKTRGS